MLKQQWAPRNISIGNFSQMVRRRETHGWKGCVRAAMLYISNVEVTALILSAFIYTPHWCQPLFPALASNSLFLKMMPFCIIFNTRFTSAVFLRSVKQALFLRKELFCSNEVLWVIAAVWTAYIGLIWIKIACVMRWEEANAFVFSSKKFHIYRKKK